MPARDLRPGRASIAARGASQPERAASPPLRVGVLRGIIDSVFCPSRCSPRAKRPDTAQRNALCE